MKKTKLLFIPVIALLLGGCNKTDTPSENKVYPTSISASISELELFTNTTYNLTELVSLSFQPENR